RGYMTTGAADANWFGMLVEWLLWPGVSLMVAATLSSFALNLWRLRGQRATPGAREAEPGWVRWLKPGGLAIAAILAVLVQMHMFDIHWSMALLAVPMAFVLATVAARVVGETGIPPI